MKTKNLRFILLFLAGTFFFFAGCKDDTNTDMNKETTADQNNALAEQYFNDIGNYTTKALTASGKEKLKSGYVAMGTDAGCLQVSFDLTAVPHKLILDFGSSNCLCEDGKYRRGKIIVSCTSGFSDSLVTLTTTLDNYAVNDNLINGTRILKNNGHNLAGHLNWDVTVNGTIVLANNGGTITYQSTHNTEMTEGELTVDYTDNVFSITGSASGSTVDSQAFTTTITTPVIFKTNCEHFVSGVVVLSPSGEPSRTLNYGNGVCDNLATITVRGITFNITLP